MNEHFDEEVLRAVAKWPDVPACYGWLGLDRRGNWLIKGARISHRRAIAFLNRHYTNEDGAWYVQNGPQRAFCDLAYTPFVYRLDGKDALASHTELPVSELVGVYVDDAGDVLLETEHGVGLIDDRDLSRFLELLALPETQAGDVSERLANLAPDGEALSVVFSGDVVPARAVTAASVPARFGYIRTPADPA